MRTNVGIVGGGPAGITLALLLQRAGVESVVLEARSRDHIEKRVRAGLLEHGTVELLYGLGVGGRLATQGLHHSGIYLRRRGRTQHIDIERLTGRRLTIYGQQELMKDLYAAAGERGIEVHFDVGDVALHDYGPVDPAHPGISFTLEGKPARLDCDYIAGCDGFHGVSRASLRDGALTQYETRYPFDWLGILAEAEPATDELIYAWHERGFSLHSMRSKQVSRLYIQVPPGERIEDWPDERIWKELQVRLASPGWRVNEGPVIEKAITPMRSYVCEPMQHGRLLLAGDAAHIVPPTGAKGLNLAVNDVRLLAASLIDWYRDGSRERLERYSETARRRVWRAQDFSNYMTTLLHQLGEGSYMEQLQLARLDHLERSEAAEMSLAENYVGLPSADDF